MLEERARLRSPDPNTRASAFEALVIEALDIRGADAQIAEAYRALSETLVRSEEAGPASGPDADDSEHTFSAWGLVFALRTFHVARELLAAFPPPSGTIVEVGSGLGPFGIAASIDAPRPVTLIDLSRTALAGAGRLFEVANLPAPTLLCVDGRLAAVPARVAGVAAPFSLSEMSRRESKPLDHAVGLVTGWLGQLCEGGRVYLVEAGAARSARFLQALRDRLVGHAYILGPCQGAAACPRLVHPQDWCHFTWRLPLGPAGQRVAARAKRKAHELHVAWLVLGAEPTTEHVPTGRYRVLEVLPRGKHEVHARLCGSGGEVTLCALRRDREAHARVTSLAPGNLVETVEDRLTNRGRALRLHDAEGLVKLPGRLGGG